MPRQRRARVARVLTLLAGLLLLASATATARFILWPGDDDPGRADAVVVLAGGAGERLREGIRLAERGVAPVLVLSHGGRCGDRPTYDVVCFTPRPDRTQGEARGAARLARERGWGSVVVVTSTYHVARTRMLFRRCLDGDVRVVGARPRTWRGLPTPRQIAWEWLGFGHALLAERGC
jgi:uncharacterized SAM-binding protein YcdF (DUF218 family)